MGFNFGYMEKTVFAALVNNAALLLVLFVIYEITYLLPYRYRRFQPIFSGLLIAMICLAIMSMPFTLQPGVIYDTRSILISVTALIFGMIPTAITVLVAGSYRIIIGGAGTLPGVAVIMSSALIGLAWRHLIYLKSSKQRFFRVYAMSVCVHLAMLTCMLLLPFPDNINIIRQITIPVLLVYPVVSVLLSVLLIRQKEFRNYQNQLKESEEKYRTFFETMSLGVVYQAADGSITSANPAAERILGVTLDQMQGKTSMDPNWKSIGEDGSEVKGSDHPAMIALRTGQPFGPFVMGVFQPQINDTVWLSINAIPLIQPGETSPNEVYATFQDITAERKASKNYWLLFHEMVDAFALHEIVCDDYGKPVDYRFLAINPAFERMTGLKSKNIIGKTVMEVLPNTEKYWIDKYGHVALTGEPIVFSEYSNVLNKYFEVSAYQPSPNQFAVTFSDVTDRVTAEYALKESEEKYSSYIENAPYGVYVVDENGQYIEVNLYASTMTGYSKDELLKMTIKDITAEDSLEIAIFNFKKLKTTGLMRKEFKYIHKNGSIRWWSVDAVKIAENRYLGFSIDITEKKEAEAELIYIVNHDTLTGVYNRRFYEDELKRIDQPDQMPLSIIIGDINGLKLINDSFGNPEGDRIIIETARIISSCCRGGDVLFRTGGDEFSVLLPRTDLESALRLLTDIQNVCKEYNTNVSNEAFHINLSLGADTKESYDTDFMQVCKRAVDYMNQSKLLEKNSSYSAIISSIKATMIEKSQETEEHAKRLSHLSRKVGEKLELSQTELDQMELLATLHDIGKIGIAERILNKPDKLDVEEWVEMKKHPEIGYRIAMSSPSIAPIAIYILHHHERWDGNGYPQKLKGTDIPLLSRILSVVDAYDAMTEDRVYRKAMTHENAIKEIEKGAGTQFDPHIAKVFVDCICSSDVTVE